MDQPRTNPAETTGQPSCMFCSSTEYQIPLISLRHEGGQAFVCPRASRAWFIQTADEHPGRRTAGPFP